MSVARGLVSGALGALGAAFALGAFAGVSFAIGAGLIGCAVVGGRGLAADI